MVCSTQRLPEQINTSWARWEHRKHFNKYLFWMFRLGFRQTDCTDFWYATRFLRVSGLIWDSFRELVDNQCVWLCTRCPTSSCWFIIQVIFAEKAEVKCYFQFYDIECLQDNLFNVWKSGRKSCSRTEFSVLVWLDVMKCVCVCVHVMKCVSSLCGPLMSLSTPLMILCLCP